MAVDRFGKGETCLWTGSGWGGDGRKGQVSVGVGGRWEGGGFSCRFEWFESLTTNGRGGDGRRPWGRLGEIPVGCGRVGGMERGRGNDA